MKARSIIFFTLAWFAAACSYREIKFEKESGRPNKVKTGDKFRIALPEDHSTHYLWALHKFPEGKITYMGSVFHGTYVDFNFTAVGKGTEELTLFLYRAKDTAQVKSFVVEVE